MFEQEKENIFRETELYIWGQKYFLLYTIKMSQFIELETQRIVSTERYSQFLSFIYLNITPLKWTQNYLSKRSILPWTLKICIWIYRSDFKMILIRLFRGPNTELLHNAPTNQNANSKLLEVPLNMKE